jgi:hypothetical protein
MGHADGKSGMEGTEENEKKNVWAGILNGFSLLTSSSLKCHLINRE